VFLRLRKSRGNDCGKDQGCGDERNVHCDEINSRGEGLTGEIARVGFFQQPDSTILAEFEVHLAVAGVYSDNLRCAALQQTISETASGRANVETSFTFDGDVPMIEGSFQLQSAAADVLEIIPEQADRTVSGNLRTRFVHLLVFYEDFTRKNERLSALARCGQAPVH
jgi:hypothetical protein